MFMWLARNVLKVLCGKKFFRSPLVLTNPF